MVDGSYRSAAAPMLRPPTDRRWLVVSRRTAAEASRIVCVLPKSLPAATLARHRAGAAGAAGLPRPEHRGRRSSCAVFLQRIHATSGLYQLMHDHHRLLLDRDSAGRDNGAASLDSGRTRH
jgi:hypothetical protein